MRLLRVSLPVCLYAACAAAQNPAATVSVDTNANRHSINPNIYGFAFGATSDLAATNFTLNRNGGNSTSTYNWQINATNHDNDYFFESILDSPGTPGYDGDNFVTQTRAAGVGAQALLTIPMLGYLAKVGPRGAILWSYSIAKYGAQTASDPFQPDAGNGIRASNGQPITGNNPLDAYVPNSVSIQQAWIQHLIATWGTAAAGGLQYYIMDNEPGLWNSTHRDIHPAGETYNELFNDYTTYAAAVRTLDPNALIVGPEDWSWWAMFLSGRDQANGINAADSDYNTHNQTYYYPWLLQNLYTYQQNTGKQLLNVLSVHYYPQELSNSDDDSPAAQVIRNQSTRALWDPAFVDPSWFNQVGINNGIVNLIPTLQSWINQYYPGLQTAITEYNWGDEANLNGATTQADLLGIFGREGLDLATRWTVPANPSPTYLALEIYRNYDGNRSTFGDTSVSASVANPDNLSAFASVRSSDGALTVMVINKQHGSTPVNISLANFSSAGAGHAYQIASANQNAITALGVVPVVANAISTTVPSQSITLFVIPSGNILSAPTAPSDLAATVGSGTVTLTWTAAGGATSFHVKRGTASGGPYAAIGTVPAATPTYPDSGLTNSTTYYYVVTGTNSAGTSPNSNEVAATPIVPPTFTSSASASPNPVAQNAATTIQASVTCSSNSLSNGNIQVMILDPGSQVALVQNFAGQNFTALQNRTYNVPFTPSLAGTYTVEVGVFSATWQLWNWNASAATLTVNSALTFTSSAHAPASVAPGGTAQISLTVTDTGSVGLSNANVELQVFNTSGTAVLTQIWNGQNFTAGGGFPYSFSWTTPANLALGSYSVDLGVFDGGWTHNYYWNTDATITVTNSPPPPDNLQSSATSFLFAPYVITSQEGPAPPANPLPPSQTGTVSLTLPPVGYDTTYQVSCAVITIPGLYIPGVATASSTSHATCDWLTASLSSNDLNAGAPTATLTVGLTNSGANNATLLPTNGGPAGNTYTGSVTLTYLGGTVAGNSQFYPVTFTVSREPLNWNATAGGVPPTTSFTAATGAGLLTPQSCGSLYSTLSEYLASNPQAVRLRVLALASQTYAFAASNLGAAGSPVTAGWLTVSQSGGAGAAASADALTCTVDATGLAPGTYTACVDAVPVNNPGPTPAPAPAVSSCAAVLPGIGRTLGTVTLTVTTGTLTAAPAGFNFSYQPGCANGFQSGPGLSPSSATLTLTNNNAGVPMQNVTVSSTLPWLALSGPATLVGGVTIPGGGSTSITLTVTPPPGPGAYNGVITLACANCTLQTATLPISLVISSTPPVSTAPGSMTFNFQQDAAPPPTQSLAVTSSCGAGPITLTPSSTGGWLLVSGSAPQFVIGVNPTILDTLAASNSPYTGTIAIATPGASTTFNVTLQLTAQPNLNVSNSGTAFSYTIGGSTPINQTIQVSTNIGAAGFTLTPASTSNWLRINGGTAMVGGTASTTPQAFTISVDPSALATLSSLAGPANPQTFNGSIAVATTPPPAAQVTPTVINYSLTIATNPALNISGCTASSFAYTLTQGGPTPANITCTVSDTSTTVGINGLSVSGVPAWLTTNLGAPSLAAGGSTTLTLTPANLSVQNAGTLPDTITISGTGATSGSASFSLIVTPWINGTIPPLTFAYTQGNQGAPAAQTLTATLAEGAATGTLTASVGPSSCTGITAPANWLTVSPSAGGFTVAADPSVFPFLTASTTCNGSIAVNSTGVTPAAATKNIPVSFTITTIPPCPIAYPVQPFTIVSGYPVSPALMPVTIPACALQAPSYTIAISPLTGGNWLTSTATTGLTGSNPGFSLGVSPSASAMAAGVYISTLTLTLTNGAGPMVLTVTLNVDAAANLTVTQTGSLGGAGILTLNVTTASPTAGDPATPMTVVATQTAFTGATPPTLLTTGGPIPTTGTAAPVPIVITSNAAVANTLPPGVYGGTLTVLIAQSGVTTSPQSVAIPWSLTIASGVIIQTTPSAAQGVSIPCTHGAVCTAAIAVSAVQNIPISVSVNSSPTGWLTLTSAPATANSTSIAIRADTSGLQSNTSYTGQVVITSTSAADSPYIIPVTLAIQVSGCQFTIGGGNNASLPGTGTSTGGFMPEVPVSVNIMPMGGCVGYAAASSDSWLTTTGGAGVTYTALSNTHPSARTATVTITNAGGGLQAVTVTEAGDTEALVLRQVRALYQSVLFRDPDSGGFSFWTGIGSAGLGQMLDSFLTSPEAFNSDFAVMAAYQAATGAPPTYAQFTTAVAAIRAGAQTPGTLFTTLITGTYSATNLYQNLLNRAPTPSEASSCTNLAYCFQTLLGLPATVAPVVVSNGLDHSNMLYVTLLYYVILGRDPDPGGLGFWQGIANGGGPAIALQGAAGIPARLQILGPGTAGQGFAGSPEFQGLYQ